MKTIVSGARPTGSLHLGNYAGAIANWLRLQETEHCYFFVADYHMLTTGFLDVSQLHENTGIVLAELLAMGVDPDKVTLFVQSDVREHAEFCMLLSMLTPVSWLERNPTYKDLMDNLDQPELRTAGFLNYPVLMAADILMYKADAVPVGQDQAPHLEITREIARRFNHLYDGMLREPQAIHISPVLMRGMDGRKMSKSYGNAISFQDTPETVREKIRLTVTDPARVRRNDPGDPDVCSVFDLHKVFNPDEAPEIRHLCQTAGIGCVECKKRVAEKIAAFHTPIHEKSRELLAHPARLADIAADGAKKAGAVAAATMAEVREAMNLGI